MPKSQKRITSNSVRLQRSAGGVLLSLWSWSSHLFQGRPGHRLQLGSGRRPSNRLMWHRKAWWACVSSRSVAGYPLLSLRTRSNKVLPLDLGYLVSFVSGDDEEEDDDDADETDGNGPRKSKKKSKLVVLVGLLCWHCYDVLHND